MKRALLILAMLNVSFIYSQAFSGLGDIKFQVGANIQQNGTGIMSSLDYGLGENISIGVAAAYLLGIDKVYSLTEGKDVPSAEFEDRIDLKARFSANLGNVINIHNGLDVYPGLHISLKNFGGHLGVRYFLSSGFGVFSELNIPLAKYNTNTLTSAETLHNQVSVNVGASFNI